MSLLLNYEHLLPNYPEPAESYTRTHKKSGTDLDFRGLPHPAIAQASTARYERAHSALLQSESGSFGNRLAQALPSPTGMQLCKNQHHAGGIAVAILFIVSPVIVVVMSRST